MSRLRTGRSSRARLVRPLSCTLLLLGGSLIAWHPRAWAHDNVVVHRRLGEESVLRLNNPFFFPYTAEVGEGSYAEDVPATRSLGHFYNPETDSAPWFALGSGAAWENSQVQYNAAMTEYGNNNLVGTDAAFHRMGRALHFIQDMTSPAHTHDDQHATDDEDFENWGPGNVDIFDYSAVTPKYAAQLSAEGFVKEIAQLVYDITAYQADIDEDESPQPNSEFKTMFPTLHWEDGGLFGDDVWEIDRVGSFDCFGNGVFCNDGWWMIDEGLIEDNSGQGGSRRLRGNAYIENTGGNSGDPIPVVFNGVPNTSNEALLHIYGRLLYPEAIAYGAGLLQVFANAVGAPQPPTATPTSTPTDTPTATLPPGVPTSTPTDTPTSGIPSATPTSTPTATVPPVCAATPLPGCKTPVVPGKASLTVRNKPGTLKDQVSFKWLSGAHTDTVEFGNPTTTTNYALCIYDDNAGVPSLAVSARAPAGGLCARGRPCWSDLNGKGFKYTDSLLTPDGVQKVMLRAGLDTKAKVQVTVKGPYVTLPLQAGGQVFHQNPSVVVQLVNDAPTPRCWEARYSAPATKHLFEQFKDKAD